MNQKKLSKKQLEQIIELQDIFIKSTFKITQAPDWLFGIKTEYTYEKYLEKLNKILNNTKG